MQDAEMQTFPAIILILPGNARIIFHHDHTLVCLHPHGGAHHPESHSQITTEFEQREKSLFFQRRQEALFELGSVHRNDRDGGIFGHGRAEQRRHKPAGVPLRRSNAGRHAKIKRRGHAGYRREVHRPMIASPNDIQEQLLAADLRHGLVVGEYGLMHRNR